MENTHASVTVIDTLPYADIADDDPDAMLFDWALEQGLSLKYHDGTVRPDTILSHVELCGWLAWGHGKMPERILLPFDCSGERVRDELVTGEQCTQLLRLAFGTDEPQSCGSVPGAYITRREALKALRASVGTFVLSLASRDCEDGMLLRSGGFALVHPRCIESVWD